MAEFYIMDTGKLDKGAVLKAICAGFEEKTEPAVCLSPGEIIIQMIYQQHCSVFIVPP